MRGNTEFSLNDEIPMKKFYFWRSAGRKTSILLRSTQDQFSEVNALLLGLVSHKSTFVLFDSFIVQIWDGARQERFGLITKMCY